MGIFDFMKKKKEDDFSSLGLGSSQTNFFEQQNPYGATDLNSGLNLGGLNNNTGEQQQFDPFGNPRAKMDYTPSYEQSMQRSPGMNNSSGDLSKDMQIIIAKLDAIKAEINNISHRLDMLESRNQHQNPYQQQQKTYW